MNGDTGEVKAIQFGRMAPTVAVSDMAAAIQFYTGVFGFKKTFENGHPVGFVILEKDQAELHLSVSANHRGATQNVAHLLVSDAPALYAVCERNGVRIIKRLRDADYGLRGFVFADPDGNRIDVGQPIHPR
jgi:catechol 2,3-dioxygenase-like lactoylglutathione lyase family enzyme